MGCPMAGAIEMRTSSDGCWSNAPPLFHRVLQAPKEIPAVGLAPLIIGIAVPSATGNVAVEYIGNRVRPLLVETRFPRHTQTRKGYLQMHSRDTVVRGGHSGLAIKPSLPERGLLIHAARYTDERLRMARRDRSRRRGLRSLQIGSRVMRLGPLVV